MEGVKDHVVNPSASVTIVQPCETSIETLSLVFKAASASATEEYPGELAGSETGVSVESEPGVSIGADTEVAGVLQAERIKVIRTPMNKPLITVETPFCCFSNEAPN